jgi:predicted HTH transcriptional regulator
MIAAGQEEYINLDFKRAPALANTDKNKSAISKDVSAFANTTGGTILYGIVEETNAPHRAISIDPIDPTVTSKEWLEQIINSRIQPRVSGVLIRPIVRQCSRKVCVLRVDS